MSESSAILAFVIDAPMQAWGWTSRFQYRETDSWPTKSALVGILAAAMGINKHDAEEERRLAPLAELRTTVLHWERTSSMQRLTDFHTVGGGYDKSTPEGRNSMPAKAEKRVPFGTVITRRSYLTDARFIALMEGPPDVLINCARVLENPRWGLWFGRKCCPPASPLGPVIAPSFDAALRALATRHHCEIPPLSEFHGVTEREGPGTYYQNDQPVAFGQHHGSQPVAYPGRPVRRFGPGELE